MFVKLFNCKGGLIPALGPQRVLNMLLARDVQRYPNNLAISY